VLQKSSISKMGVTKTLYRFRYGTTLLITGLLNSSSTLRGLTAELMSAIPVVSVTSEKN